MADETMTPDGAETAARAMPVAVPAMPLVVPEAPCAAEAGRPGWALLGLLLAVSAAIAIMALGISAG